MDIRTTLEKAFNEACTNRNLEAPEKLTAFRVDENKVDMSRPLCVFPQRAVYVGSGSTSEATNFECREPD